MDEALENQEAALTNQHDSSGYALIDISEMQ